MMSGVLWWMFTCVSCCSFLFISLSWKHCITVSNFIWSSKNCSTL